MPTPPIDERSSMPVLIAVEDSFIEYLRELNLDPMDWMAKNVGVPPELLGEPEPDHVVES